MSAGVQCDNCRTFSPHRAPGWFSLVQQPGEGDQLPTLFTALFGSPGEPLTFCTVTCLADWAFVQKLAAEAARTEPT